MFVFYQPNPLGKSSNDCAVRAISKLFGMSWDEAFMLLVNEAYHQAEMPSSNAVIMAILRNRGFKKYNLIENKYYTVSDFADQHTYGVYAIFTGEHIVAEIDGDYYDAWDCGNEIPLSYWICERREDLGV